MLLSIQWPEVGLVGLLFNYICSFMTSFETLVSSGVFSSKDRDNGWEKTAASVPAPALHHPPLRCARDPGVLQYTV